jgi:small subunit ribosomal protein S18
MGRKLFVSNLDFEIQQPQLQELFTEVGAIVSVVIASDRETKRSKGFAFVEMESDDDAKKAIEALNNKVVNGRPIKVVEDRGKGGGVGAPAGEGGEGARRHEFLPPVQRMQLFRRRKKLDPFMQDSNKTIDYRDVTVLSRFVSERGKILSRRFTGLNAYNQRKVTKAIKRAQNLGLMGFSNV